jgi:hypothetical protein
MQIDSGPFTIAIIYWNVLFLLTDSPAILFMPLKFDYMVFWKVFLFMVIFMIFRFKSRVAYSLRLWFTCSKFLIILFLYYFLIVIFIPNLHTFYNFNLYLYKLVRVFTANLLSLSSIRNSFSIGLNFEFQYHTIFFRLGGLSCYRIALRQQMIARKVLENSIILGRIIFLLYFDISQRGSYTTLKLTQLAFHFVCRIIIYKSFLKYHGHFQGMSSFILSN